MYLTVSIPSALVRLEAAEHGVITRIVHTWPQKKAYDFGSIAHGFVPNRRAQKMRIRARGQVCTYFDSFTLDRPPRLRIALDTAEKYRVGALPRCVCLSYDPCLHDRASRCYPLDANQFKDERAMMPRGRTCLMMALARAGRSG